MSSSYKVGYGKPPTHAQFKKGQSGNPAGRLKGAKNHATVLEKVLNQKVRVRDGGKIKQITMFEAMMHSAAHRAMKGDTKAFLAIMAQVQKAGLLDPPADEANSVRGGVLLITRTNETQEELEARLAKQQDELQKHHRYVKFPKSPDRNFED